MLGWSLQLFAEKTERPTAKRRTDAKQEGRMAKSPEFTTSVSFIGIAGAFWVFGNGLYTALRITFTDMLGNGTLYAGTHSGVPSSLFGDLTLLLSSLIPIIAAALGMGILAAYVQVGPLFNPSILLPDFSRISPLQGWKRLFSLRAAVELLKSVVKLSFIGIAVYVALTGSQTQINQLIQTNPAWIFAVLFQRAFAILIDVAVMFFALSIADLVYQRFDFQKSLRMTKQEVKDETKQAEGNPMIKRKLRERGRAMAFRRMMKKVPTADVVVTNPTHYAVALRYDAGTMHAPQVVAKGVDELAKRIREIAQDNDVPIVENRPLARSLYQLVDLDGFVPGELFQAVAEVLAYVYRLKRRTV